MAKYYVMGNFSQKGVKGFLTGGSNRESVVKSACEAMGCKFISYDITEGEFDFILVLEGDSEQIIAAKGGACLLYTSPSPRDATLSRMPSSA